MSYPGVSLKNDGHDKTFSSITPVYSKSISSKPASFNSANQAADCANCSSKRRITVDNSKRVELTEYFYAHNGKVSPKEASQLFSIGFENCRKLLRKLHRGEVITEVPSKRTHASKLLPEHEAIIEKLIFANPKVSNQSIANTLGSLEQNPISVSRSTIRRHRQRLLSTLDTLPADISTEETATDSQFLESDLYSYDLDSMNFVDDFSSSYCSISNDLGLEEKWIF